VKGEKDWRKKTVENQRLESEMEKTLRRKRTFLGEQEGKKIKKSEGISGKEKEKGTT